METTGMPSYTNLMQKTASDRFTSLKKNVAVKVNKFSSSGIGHFGTTSNGLPPMSPTPATIMKNNSNVFHHMHPSDLGDRNQLTTEKIDDT
jgi:hypothetical protein